MTAKKTNINQKNVHIDQKVVKNDLKTSKNVKKSQNNAKKCSKCEKLCFSEEQLCDVAGMFFRCELQVARLTALLGLFFADKTDKYRLLKEYMAVDRFMLKFSADCHEQIAKMAGITAELADADEK